MLKNEIYDELTELTEEQWNYILNRVRNKRMPEKYLEFTGDKSKSGLTKIISIWSKGDNYLGQISYFSPWRKYVFMPGQETIFDVSCMKEIIEKIESLMRERYEGKT